MNRYKQVSLSIVRKWDEPGRSLVDDYLEFPLQPESIGLITVAGPAGSGKTVLASIIANRLNLLGQEHVAIIDGEAEQAIAAAVQSADDSRLRSVHRIIMQMGNAVNVRGPVIICMDYINRISHSALLLSSLVWVTERRRTKYRATLEKCRRPLQGLTDMPYREIHAPTEFDERSAEPFVAEGFRIARSIRSLLGR